MNHRKQLLLIIIIIIIINNNNDSPHKNTINIIKTIVAELAREKFITEKFHTSTVSKDMISLYSEYTSIKDSKKKYVIYIYIYM